jgi:rubrerythrin
MYYGMGPYTGQTTMAIQPELINLILEAMRDEKQDRAKYNMMMDMTDDEKIKRQINFAYVDEGKHYKMFRHILHCLTGRTTDVQAPEVKRPDNLLAAVETSIDGELEAVEMYRNIKSMLPQRNLRDMLYEIITDEQEHATRFVYVYSMMTDS